MDLEQTAREALAIDWDCGDNSCLFAKNKTGMRTNGGCRCLQKRSSSGYVLRLMKVAQGYLDLLAENENRKVKLTTLKNDYWFMTNLLEKYSSSDKEQAVKDCVYRMNFRQPFFKGLENIDNEITQLKSENEFLKQCVSDADVHYKYKKLQSDRAKLVASIKSALECTSHYTMGDILRAALDEVENG